MGDTQPASHPSAGGPVRPDADRGLLVPSALVVLALFTTHGATGLYSGLDHQLPAAVSALSTAAMGMSLVAWFWTYSRRHGIAWPMDMGWFLWMVWILLIPYYVVKREGRRGLLRLGLFALVWFAAWATAWAVAVWVRLLTSEP